MIKIPNALFATAVALFIPVMTGCDNGNSDTVNNDDYTNRYDLAYLALNPDEIGHMPSNLTVEDVIQYTPLNEDLTENNVVIPKSDGEDDWVLRAVSSGVITMENQRYKYVGGGEMATITLSVFDSPVGEEFDAGMSLLADTGANRGNSLSSILTTEKYPVNAATIFQLAPYEREAIREAVLSLGYIAVDMPDAVAVGAGFNGSTVQVDVDNIVLRRTRSITHTVTSTNADILETGEVRGTFSLVDTYYDLAVEAGVADLYYRVIIARIPTHTENLQVQLIQPMADGEFVLQLGDLENVNPNP